MTDVKIDYFLEGDFIADLNMDIGVTYNILFEEIHRLEL